MKKIASIKFREKHFDVLQFKYMSSRDGLLLVNGKSSFNGTLDMDKIPVMSNEIIVKNHDTNYGLLDCLIEHNVIEKQAIPRILGNNTVYICKLKQNERTR